MNDNILEMAKSPLDKFNDNLFSIEKSTCGNLAKDFGINKFTYPKVSNTTEKMLNSCKEVNHCPFTR